MSIDETLVRWHAEEQEIRASLAAASGVARSEQIHGKTGMQIATAEGRLVGPDGKLYAHATTTCLIFDQQAG